MTEDFDSIDEVPEASSYAAPTVGDITYDDIEGGEIIGSGGFAQVSLTVVDGTDIVVKEPLSTGKMTIKRQETIDAFFDEAETWAQLDDHDHILSVFDWGENLPWIALEHMDGGSLTERLASGSLATDEALWIGICLSRAVRHAHRHGICHLDITPNNVLFRETEPGQWLLPKIGDWGLSQTMVEQTGTVEDLTPNYAAPEQFDPDKHGQPDDYTDRFQLATVVYEMVTGEQAFSGSAATVMRKILDADVTPPTTVNPGLPDRLDDIFDRALAVTKEDRYETVVNFRRDLTTVFEDIRERDDAQLSGHPEQESDATVATDIGSTASNLPSATDSTIRTDRLVDRLPEIDTDIAYADPLTAPFDGERRVPAVADAPLRIPLGDVYTISGMGTVSVGRIETGTLATGQSVSVRPSDVSGTVETIEMHHEEVPDADPGDEVGFSISRVSKDDIRRGDICGPAQNPPAVAEAFEARLVVGDHPSVITAGYTPVVHAHTAQVACRVESLDATLDAESGTVVEEHPDFVQSGDIADVVLQPQKPLSVEPVTRIPELGTFSVRDMGDTVGVGIVLDVHT
jgi:serine/threonine protein kinase